MISVLMSVYNEPVEFLRESVLSILNQNYKNIEFIIVIDNPQNKEARSFLEDVAKRDQRLILVKNKVNRGLTFSLNKAFNLSRGKYIARMDADDISQKDRLYKELNYLIRNSLDLVSSNTINFYKDSFQQTNYPYKDSLIKFFLKYGNCMPHPTWLIKRDAFVRLNGYREVFACEDYDFLLRGALIGLKYGLIKEPLLKYRINNTGITRSNVILQQQISCLLQAAYKNSKILALDYLNRYLNSNQCQIQTKELTDTWSLKVVNLRKFLAIYSKSKFIRNVYMNRCVTKLIELFIH